MNQMPLSQIPLGLRLRESATFDNFFAGHNAELLDCLQGKSHEPLAMVYFWGGVSSGKTHLLHALCHRAHVTQTQVFYLPLKAYKDLSPSICDGLTRLSSVLIDDIASIAGDLDWEKRLFVLCNEMREQGKRLIVAGAMPPLELPLHLPDLRSRLAWGLVYRLRPIDDMGKGAALKQRAEGKGLTLPDEVVTFMLTRCARDMASLFALLDHLDQASMVRKRRLTIPFIKTCLAGLPVMPWGK